MATDSVDLKVEQQVGGSYGFDKDYTWIFMWISWGISSGYGGLVGTMFHLPRNIGLEESSSQLTKSYFSGGPTTNQLETKSGFCTTI